MSYTVRNLCQIMEELAPLDLALEWDNVGLQIGDPNKGVSRVLVTLTVTADVAEKAVAQGVDMIIAHHPVIFRPLRQIRTDEPKGALLALLIKNDVAVYVAHTNLDQASRGLNHWLARALGLENSTILVPGPAPDSGLGRVGTIRSLPLGKLAQQLEELWGSPIKIVGNPARNVSTIAVVGGSGGDFIKQAHSVGADVLVTGDVSYHDAIDALELGLAVLDAGHFATEKVMVSEVANALCRHFGGELNILQDAGDNPFGVDPVHVL